MSFIKNNNFLTNNEYCMFLPQVKEHIEKIDNLCNVIPKNNYLVSCENEPTIISLFDELTDPNKGNGFLKTNIECINYMYDDENSCIFNLTEDQYLQLRNDVRVKNIFKLPLFKAQTSFTQSLCPDRSSLQGTQFDNWGLSRCCSLSSTNLPQEINYYYTGSGVDIVMIDEGILANGSLGEHNDPTNPNPVYRKEHPEFRDRNGNSRLQLIDWTLLYTITSPTEYTVSVSGNKIYLNNIPNPPILTYENSVKGDGYWGQNYRNIFWRTFNNPKIYKFNLNNLSSTPYRFVISNSPHGFPLSGKPTTNLINNNSNVGDLILTGQYFGSDGFSAFTSSFQVIPVSGLPYIMYYYLSSNAGPILSSGNIITPTYYNTQNEKFYTSDAGIRTTAYITHNNNTYYYDGPGINFWHGSATTSVAAGSTYGFAKDANIYFMNSIGYGAYYGMPYMTNNFLGIDLVILWHKWKKTQPSLSARPTVVNNSWGFGGLQLGCNYSYINSSPSNPQPIPILAPSINFIDEKVKEAITNGIHFIKSAGNLGILNVKFGDTLYNECSAQFQLIENDGIDGITIRNITAFSFREGSPKWPEYEESGPVINVGGINNNIIKNSFEVKAAYSNYGPSITLFAPSDYIQSTFSGVSGGWPSFSPYKGYKSGNYQVNKWTGTSFSSPLVAGIVATILEKYPQASPLALKNFLIANSIKNCIFDYIPELPPPVQFPVYILSGSPNLFAYQFPGKQYFFNDLNSVSSVNIGNDNYLLSSNFNSYTSPILSSSSYTSFSHTFSSLSSALINLIT